VLAHIADRLGAWHAVDDGQAGQGGSGASAPSGAGELDPLGGGATPGFGEQGQHAFLIGWQPEVRPAQPP